MKIIDDFCERLRRDNGVALSLAESGIVDRFVSACLAHDVSDEKRDESGKWTTGGKKSKKEVDKSAGRSTIADMNVKTPKAVGDFLQWKKRQAATGETNVEMAVRYVKENHGPLLDSKGQTTAADDILFTLRRYYIDQEK